MNPSNHRYFVITYGQSEIRRRRDGRHVVYAVITQGDVGLVSTADIRAAIEHDQPWRNPLKWVQVWVTSNRDEALLVRSYIKSTGSPLDCLRPGFLQWLQTEWKVDGGSGKDQSTSSNMEVGSSSWMMVQSGQSPVSQEKGQSGNV
jgi:hypothetical protein